MEERSLSTRVEVLDVMVELLTELGHADEGVHGAVYDRLCEAVCRLSSMERAVLVLYDDVRKLVIAVGCHGIERELLSSLYGTLDETPIAQRALAEDRVVELQHDEIAPQVPPRYAGFANGTTMTCTPVAAGGRWLGVILADRGGEGFGLTEAERGAMWTLGRFAALAASAEIATSQQERARLLTGRIDLAREIHERVVQRLFGVSLALGADRDLSREERERCAVETRSALADLRSALARAPSAAPRRGEGTLREELDRLRVFYTDPPIEVDWEEGVEPPAEVDRVAQTVLAEALRNASKHAEPTRLAVSVAERDGAFALEVVNDGAGGNRSHGGAGMGLRLAAFEALERGGVVEFGPGPNDDWRVRLVVPLPAEDE
ncbi:MAG: GAF domain-containing sensor histidine kinase [Solirubrobacteraceae bacterium]